ncbi:ATP-binding protein [Streptomyces sp. NPDC012461]|jgi:signal transduction histidine kinase|uniref:histidine kinase n=2 Tax=unclassified Streptomyces TaxID=2593676 RepID=A0A6G3QUF9_9ACTN|nr:MULTISPECIES: ATP-binding protein [unclassified Streptomyces]MBM7091412.1 sensor histidine kinase [Streptomyces sp. S12]NEA87133.1 sensor histidine kinase [Streptomyces sp. SID14436]NEC28106.1 sensor histidine kinase [Streptomyces sp. SID8111]NEC77752.1 sensor histidine kinase [Streptomyces sp. SID7958]NED18226.1 sensor histidine kinase [Streptomyces sp. SID9913]
MTEYTGNPLLWALLVALVGTISLIVRQRRHARALRQEIQGLRDHYAELESDYGKSVQAAQERAEEETKTVLKSAMRTLQGLAAEQQLVLSRLQSKYGDSAMLQDLLEIDHTNSQFGRRAQSIAVLCDGWLGGRRDTASVYDVVRSAQGRIRHFRRVEILSQVDFGITSRAVEPAALALAELLDNATSYSSPDTIVEINIRTVPKGICVVVDDAGVGMSEEERARAQKLLSSERASSVAGLGNPPQFGFAVIGVLCERFGFEVSVDSSSPYGGVRAVVLLPHELLTAMPERKAPAPAARPAANGPDDGPEPSPAVPASTVDGLPRRRRKRPMAIVPGTASAPRPAGRSDSEQAQVMGAFQRGTQSGRVTQPEAGDQTSSTPGARSEGHDVS